MGLKNWVHRKVSLPPWWVTLVYCSAAFLFGFDAIYLVKSFVGAQVAWDSEVTAAWGQAIISGLAILGAVGMYKAGETARQSDRHYDDYDYMAKVYHVCLTIGLSARAFLDDWNRQHFGLDYDGSLCKEKLKRWAASTHRALEDLVAIDPVAIRDAGVSLEFLYARREVSNIHNELLTGGEFGDAIDLERMERSCNSLINHLQKMAPRIMDFSNKHGLKGVEPVLRT